MASEPLPGFIGDSRNRSTFARCCFSEGLDEAYWDGLAFFASGCAHGLVRKTGEWRAQSRDPRVKDFRGAPLPPRTDLQMSRAKSCFGSMPTRKFISATA